MRIASTCVLVCSALSLPWFGAAQNGTATAEEIAANPELDSECSLVWIEFCKRESTRYCYLDDIEDKKCGSCLPGYVEFRARCISEDQVGIIEFLQEYAPQYLQPRSNEDRLALLIRTITFIQDIQSRNPPPPFEIGLNMFSADSEEDTLQRFGFLANITVPESENNLTVVMSSAPEFLPDTVDWVTAGAVTAVKDQGRCGCCWAVTVAGVIEGAAAINNGYLQSLSHQQFISCDEDNFGCGGGSLVYAMIYGLQNEIGGVATLEDYEYTDHGGTTTGTCKAEDNPLAVKVDGGSYVVDFYDDYSFDERLQRMKDAVSVQPVAIVIKSNCQLFSSYLSGILTEDQDCECTEPLCADHAVLIVGFNDTASPSYWKIKNSWSTKWGEKGFVRIAQTEKGRFGLFGVLLHGVVPSLAYNVTGEQLEAGPQDAKDLNDYTVDSGFSNLRFGFGMFAATSLTFFFSYFY
jgi:cathepsin L